MRERQQHPSWIPTEYVGWPTLKLIGGTTFGLLAGSWIEKFLAPLVGFLLLLVGFVFLPYILVYDLSVLIHRALDGPDWTEERGADREERLVTFQGPAGENLRCAYCHDGIEGLTHTCSECATVVHAACQGELGGCPTLGCGKAAATRVRRPA